MKDGKESYTHLLAINLANFSSSIQKKAVSSSRQAKFKPNFYKILSKLLNFLLVNVLHIIL